MHTQRSTLRQGRTARARARALAAAILATVPLAAPREASAVPRSWIPPAGNWATPGNWTTGVVPLAGDEAIFQHGDLDARTATYDYTGPAITLAAVRLGAGAQAASSSSIVQSANVLTATVVQLGTSGRGFFSLSGGTNTIVSDLSLGINTNGRGVYNLSGTGRLDTSATGSVSIGVTGLGTFNHSGGFFNALGTVSLGRNAGSSGTYAFSGGRIDAAQLYVGNNGAGTFDHSGGSSRVDNEMRLGSGTTSTGFYTLRDAGSLTVAQTANITYVGFGGAGTFNHSGGTFDARSGLVLGRQAGSRGTYALSGGSTELMAPLGVTVGSEGAGTFVHSAGTLTIRHPDFNGSTHLRLGFSAGSTGMYTLSGGALVLEGNFSDERIGEGGAGTFLQTGGTHFIRGAQTVGGIGGTGTYLLGGGMLTIRGSQSIEAGSSIHHSGGTSQVSGPGGLSVDGTYALSGNGVLTVTDTQNIGERGSGTFIQTGGTNNVGPAAPIPGFPLSAGANLNVGGFGETSAGYYRLAGGTFNGNGAIGLIGSIGEVSGPGLGGTFEQTGGVNTFNGLLIIGNIAGATTGGGTFLFNGGSLAVNPTVIVEPLNGLEFLLDGLVLSDRGTFASNSPTSVFSGKFTHDGGTVTGVLRNHGTFVYNRGTFAAEMINRGTFVMNGTATFAAPVAFTNEDTGVVNAGGTFTAALTNRGTVNAIGTLVFTQAITNNGAINVAAGASSNPTLVNNFNLINLTGGKLLGSGSVGNNAGGVISGGGTVQLNIVQNGGILRADNPAVPLTVTSPLMINDPTSQIVVAPNSRMNLISAFTNPAIIALQGGGAQLAGASITNTGTIRGAGEIANPIVNLAAGQIQVGANTLRFTQGLQTNAGTISLAGGELDNGATTLANSGRILGRGTYRGGPLNNTGTVLFSGGVSDVFAPVNNANRINVTSAGAASFYDAVNTSVGTINVNLGSTATFFGPVTGLDHFTGAGVKEFEAAAAGGAIETRDGTTVVGPAGNLTAGFIRDAHLSIVGRAAIAPDGTASATSRVNVLEIDGSPDNWVGQLNLTNNALVIDHAEASPVETVRNQINSGRAGGAWTGTGITTSGGNASQFALGYAPSSALFTSFPATFVGQLVDDTAILLRLTRYGDANLDQVVNLADFNRLAGNFGATNAMWSQGDFNYDGIVNLQDFNHFAANFGLSAAPDGIVDPASWAALASAVPEPAAVALALAGLLVMIGPRRRRA